MILEATIISLCLGNYECNVAPRAYYLSKPEMRSWVKEKTKDIKEMVKATSYEGEISTLAGFMFIAAGGRANLRLSKNIAVSVSQEQCILRFTYAF